MAYTSEIEKLEQRYRENPKGRNFAPLADAYRKAGLVDNAIELCEAGLKLHPDYISAYIVFGRCLVDKKDDTQAEKTFQKVLALDPENILALRTLAEIAERGKRFEVAIDALSKLLAADPMNGDAAETLARLKGKAAAAAKSAPAPPPAAASPPP
ncbi:MAG: tetratricopeptide repeat protein, partial [Gemmatimonadales bacterium]